MVGVVGGGGLELRLSPCATEELDAVDVVSCAVAVVSLGPLGFEELVSELVSESMTVARRNGERFEREKGGKSVVLSEANSKNKSCVLVPGRVSGVSVSVN